MFVVVINWHVWFADAFLGEKLSDSMETIRSDFALDLEADGAGGMVGIQSARGSLTASTNPLNFSLRNFGTELRFGPDTVTLQRPLSWEKEKHFNCQTGI